MGVFLNRPTECCVTGGGVLLTFRFGDFGRLTPVPWTNLFQQPFASAAFGPAKIQLLDGFYYFLTYCAGSRGESLAEV